MQKSNIFIGSNEIVSDVYEATYSPIDGSKIGEYAVCSVDTTKQALSVAERAFGCSKITPLHQRLAWINDVADRLF